MRATTELKETFVNYFNRGDYKAIYALASGTFRREVPEEAFVGFLKNQIAPLGKVMASELTEDLGEVKYFRRVSADSRTVAERAAFAVTLRCIPN